MEGARKIGVSSVSKTQQFSVTINGVPKGATVRGISYAKLANEDETIWVFSEEQSMTNN